MNTEVVGKKLGMTIRLTEEAAHDYFWAERFPRKHHKIIHPITDEERRVYKDLKRRWKKAKAEWEAVMQEAQTRGLSYWGWTDDDPHFGKLEPRIEYVYEETDAEWRERVARIVTHHTQTGEWLEEPRPTFHELTTSLFLGTAFTSEP